jgi:hypothetical protein
MVNSENLRPYKKPELDILGYFPINQSTSNVSQISELSQKVFNSGMRDQSFYLSLFKVPSLEFTRLYPEYKADSATVTILRSVFMKPEQAGFVEELVKRIEKEI